MCPATTAALYVDFLPASALPLPGRLGLTRAPGRHLPGRTGDPDDWLREDLAVIAGSHGTRLLVTLLEPLEVAKLGDLAAAVRGAGLRWAHFPIPDVWIPSDLPATRRLVRRVLRTLRRGEGVVVHCWGGLGRSGTIAACTLVAAGHPPDRAIALVRDARPGAVEVPAQEQFVRDFAPEVPCR